MNRRLLIAALGCWPAARLAAQDEGRPRYKVSAAQLYEALSDRFPMRFGIPGLLELAVTPLQLLMLPTRNKLGASLRGEASGPGIDRMQQGTMDLVFALRYESRDRSIRAYEPDIMDMRWPGLSGQSLQALQMIVPGMAREIAAELVLHTFTARELALPDTMGFEPESLTVVEDGVSVGFRSKLSR